MWWTVPTMTWVKEKRTLAYFGGFLYIGLVLLHCQILVHDLWQWLFNEYMLMQCFQEFPI
jgi:hypothetical protein